MNPQKTGLGLLLSIFSASLSFAQVSQSSPQPHSQPPAPAQAPMVAWQCRADCFGLEGKDGATLRYWGGVRTGLFYDQGEAFSQLKDSCGSRGLLVIRKLKGTVTQTQITDVLEQDSEVTQRSRWYGLQVIHTSNRRNRYQVLDHELRAIFDVQEANSSNACESRSIYHSPIFATPKGDRVHG